MNVRRGDVVVVDFPYSDQSGRKIRPTIVVQADYWNTLLADTILATVTSSRRRHVHSETQLEIDITSPDGAATGLRMNSVVQCENLITFDRTLIQRKLGRLSDAQLMALDACLKAVLGLH